MYKSKYARYRPRKDIGLRYSDEEFAEEFVEPIRKAESKRSPSRHTKLSHDMEFFPGE